METKGITKEDLLQFKAELLREIRKLQQHSAPGLTRPWLKSHEVQKMLKISAGTLQHLRDSGALKFSKVGGLIFYEMKDIEEMIRISESRLFKESSD